MATIDAVVPIMKEKDIAWVILKNEFFDKLEETLLTCSKCKELPRNLHNNWWNQPMCHCCFDNLSCIAANLLDEFSAKCKYSPNGCQVFKILKDLRVHEINCVYSAKYRKNDDKLSFKAGLDDYLLKPNHYEDLRNTGKSQKNQDVPLHVPEKAVTTKVVFSRISTMKVQ
jgi:hypothetical protein